MIAVWFALPPIVFARAQTTSKKAWGCSLSTSQTCQCRSWRPDMDSAGCFKILKRKKTGRRDKKNWQFAENKWPQLTTDSRQRLFSDCSCAFRQPLPFGHPAALWDKELSYTLLANCLIRVREVPHPASSGITQSIILQLGNAIPQSLSSMQDIHSHCHGPVTNAVVCAQFCGFWTIAFGHGTLNISLQ